MEMILDAIVFYQNCGISLIMVGCKSDDARSPLLTTGILCSSTTAEELFSLLS